MHNKNTRYLGDAVYATFDGYGIELRVDTLQSKMVVYLEPDILTALVNFYSNSIRRANPDYNEN